MSNHKKSQKNRVKHLHLSIALVIIGAVVAVAGTLYKPKKTEALNLANLMLTPFGGKVEYWTPQSPDPGCTAITTAISIATLGTVNITFEELKIGKPKETSTGIIKINGQKIPGLPHVYDYNKYQFIGTNTVGNSLDICNVCDKKAFEKVPLVKNVCKTKYLDKVTDKACKAVGSICSPLTNLLYSIGTAKTPSL